MHTGGAGDHERSPLRGGGHGATPTRSASRSASSARNDVDRIHVRPPAAQTAPVARVRHRTPTISFVTICTADRREVLSHIDDQGEVQLSAIWRVIVETWFSLADRFPVDLIAFVAMPDHIHGLLRIQRDDTMSEATPSLGTIIGAFKSLAWHRARSVEPALETLWQRGFHDRVVRCDGEYDRVLRYIAENPTRWATERRTSPTPTPTP